MNKHQKNMEDLPAGFEIEMMPGRVLLKIVDRTTKAGLVLPGASAQKLDEAIVVRAGKPLEESWNGPKIEGGERVLFFKSSPIPVEIGKEQFLVGQFLDIFGILTITEAAV